MSVVNFPNEKKLPITWYVTFAKLDGEFIHTVYESVDYESVKMVAEKACSNGAIVHEISVSPPQRREDK